jgi:predicted nucleic acid-binding protein
MAIIDALATARMEAGGVMKVYGYDGHFDLVIGVIRIEP